MAGTRLASELSYGDRERPGPGAGDWASPRIEAAATVVSGGREAPARDGGRLASSRPVVLRRSATPFRRQPRQPWWSRRLAPMRQPSRSSPGLLPRRTRGPSERASGRVKSRCGGGGHVPFGHRAPSRPRRRRGRAPSRRHRQTFDSAFRLLPAEEARCHRRAGVASREYCSFAMDAVPAASVSCGRWRGTRVTDEGDRHGSAPIVSGRCWHRRIEHDRRREYRPSSQRTDRPRRELR